jgi:hypothetical protein
MTEPTLVTQSQSSDGAVSTRKILRVSTILITKQTQTPSTASLYEENSRLTAELRAAREKIRNLELQVEGMKANAQKAAQAAQAVLES